MTAREVPCPACRRAAAYHEGNPWRPFCSERCRTLDLGAWASESYRVASGTGESERDDDESKSAREVPPEAH